MQRLALRSHNSDKPGELHGASRRWGLGKLEIVNASANFQVSGCADSSHQTRIQDFWGTWVGLGVLVYSIHVQGPDLFGLADAADHVRHAVRAAPKR